MRRGRLFSAHYRVVLRLRRRIINITSAAPAAIQMTACNIVLLMFSRCSFPKIYKILTGLE